MRTTQGKCCHCRVRFVWTGLPLLRDASCQRCEAPLEATTRYLRWPTAYENPVQFVWADDTARKPVGGAR